ADARLSDHRDHLATALARPVEGVPELLQLGAAPDKAREPASRCGLEAGMGGADPLQFEHLDSLAEPLDRHWSKWGDLNKTRAKPQRLGGELDTAWRRELLHAGCQVRGTADRGIVHPQIASNRAYHDLAGVEPNANLHEQAIAPPHFIGVALHRLLHAKS